MDVARDETTAADEPALPDATAWEALDATIRTWWSTDLGHATEDAVRGDPEGKLLFLPFPFLAPSGATGAYTQMYAWDTDFISRALLVHERFDLVRGHILNSLSMVERFGYVPNANHAAAVTRSQTPLLPDTLWRYFRATEDADLLLRAYPLLKQEYCGYWTAEHHSTPIGLATNRDLGDAHWPPALAAEAETGLDWTPIFGGDVRRCAPLITNCALVRYARVLALIGRELGRDVEAEGFEQDAERRAAAIRDHCWDERSGAFLEFDHVERQRLPYLSACTLWPLWAAVATRDQAARVVEGLHRLEQSHGVASTDRAYADPHPDTRSLEPEAASDAPAELVGGRGQLQWMYPAGWAPEQLIAVEGLDRYGYERAAERIAARFLALVLERYDETGMLWEKYNVVDGSLVLPNSRYGNVPMRGWTAAAVVLLGRRLFRPRAAAVDGQASNARVERPAPRVAALIAALDRLEELPDPAVELRHPQRDPGRRPRAGEDPYNAIVRFCEVRGAPDGALAGARVGVKDNIAVAGVPMSVGDATAPTITPSEDAVVVERLLDAGAWITATTNIDAAFGVPRNPVDPAYSSGGSSSGSAAAVAGGLVDAALGADQGGSIRIPAAWCGIVGMKPTHGLVPCHGLDCWDRTLDHIGPLTTDVERNATMLEVIAGPDWRDHQARDADGAYAETARLGARGLRIGAVGEALEPSGCTPEVLAAFHRAGERLAAAGAEIVPVSVPLWTDAFAIWLAAVALGVPSFRESFGLGHGTVARVDPVVVGGTVARRRHGGHALPFETQAMPLALEHLRGRNLEARFGRVQNLRLELGRQIDARLREVDVLIMPTTPVAPSRLAAARPVGASLVDDYRAMLNTCPLNLTGHPALTVPCGRVANGLPTGLQIVARRFGERTVYRAGFALEAAT